MFKVLESCRVIGEREMGNNGVFSIPHHRIIGYMYNVQASDGMDWEHVSISLVDIRSKKAKTVKRCPTWEEMCYIKSVFWDDEDAVMQIHPPKSEYINNHAYVLHLWKPIGKEIFRPPSILVGMPGDNLTIK